MNGWILLHKKIWQSENFKFHKNKTNILLIWIWLLTHCDENGVVTAGRYQIAEDTGIHPSSVKRALEQIRFQMSDEVTSEVTNQYTKICILNWQQYQRKANSNRLTSDSQVTTNKEERIKNKEEYSTILEVEDKLQDLQEKFKTKSVLAEYEQAKDWLASSGKKYKNYLAFFRNWLRRAKDTRTPSKTWTPPKDEPVNADGIKKLNALKANFKKLYETR